MKKESKREHFEHFNIAGFSYYEGAMVFNKLSIGTELQLVPEPENPFDKNAVALYLGESKLGFIPRGNNREISKLLNAGYSVFKAVVQMVNPKNRPEEQIMVIVYIEKRTK